MKLKQIVFAITALGLAAFTGCTLINQNIAMGDGADAEEAVARLDNQEALENVSLYSQNLNARIKAVGKLNGLSRLTRFIEDEDKPTELRLAAFQRIVALGKAEAVLRAGSSLNKIIVFGTIAVPDEWRIKAMHWDSSIFRSSSYDDNAEFLCNQSISMNVRKESLGKIELDSKGFAKLLEEAVKPGREDCAELIRRYQPERNLMLSLMDVMRDAKVPDRAKMLAFSAIKDEEVLVEALKEALWGAKDNSANATFFKWAVANAKNNKALGELVCNPGTFKKEVAAYLEETVRHIDDDEVLLRIIDNHDIKSESKLASIALTAVSRLKDPEKRKTVGRIVAARNSLDMQTRVNAIVDVYAADPKSACEIVETWFTTEHYEGNLKGADITGKIRDMKTLLALIDACQKGDIRACRNEVLRGLKKGLLNTMDERVSAMPKEKFDRLVSRMIDIAKKLDSEGKTCVIGNYYVGMPLAGFIALNKTQKVKAVPMDWKLNAEIGRIVISEFALDAKNLYEATGVEKSQVMFSLPHKLGIPPFKLGATKIKVERNYSFGAQMLESMGDYSNSINVSGGDVFYKCECQAKHVTVTYWDKSGILDVEEL